MTSRSSRRLVAGVVLSIYGARPGTGCDAEPFMWIVSRSSQDGVFVVSAKQATMGRDSSPCLSGCGSSFLTKVATVCPVRWFCVPGVSQTLEIVVFSLFRNHSLWTDQMYKRFLWTKEFAAGGNRAIT